MSYRLQNSLYLHVKRTHENSKSYKCETCAKAFLNETTLNKHKKDTQEFTTKPSLIMYYL